MNRQIRVGDSKYGTFDNEFYPCPYQPPNPQIFHYKYQYFCSKHAVPVIIDAHSAKHFLHNLGTGSSLPQTIFRAKINGGSGLGEHVNIWDPCLFLQPLKLTTSNLVYNLGLGSILPRNNFYDQNWQGSGLGEHTKKLGPLFISATVEASNFKFGTQLQFGEYVTITTLVPNLVMAGWAYRSTSKIVGITYSVPRTLYQVKATEM